MNILIAEKDTDSLKSIVTEIRKHKNINLFTCFSKFSEIIQILNNNHVDVVFIDLEMLRSHVCVCIRLLIKKFKGVKLILISNTINYLEIAFDVMAVGYIIKPIQGAEVYNCIRRLERRNSDLVFLGLMIHYKGKDTFLNYDEILFIEASNRKCIIHTDKEEFEIYKSIKIISEELPMNIFFKSHRAFIINMTKIKSIEQYNKTSYNISFQNSKVALLSRRFIKTFKSRYNSQKNTVS